MTSGSSGFAYVDINVAFPLYLHPAWQIPLKRSMILLMVNWSPLPSAKPPQVSPYIFQRDKVIHSFKAKTMLRSFTMQTKYQMADGTIFTILSSASITRVPGLPDQENTLLPPEEVQKALTDAAALARQQALENMLEIRCVSSHSHYSL
jgi:hypothetical protein